MAVSLFEVSLDLLADQVCKICQQLYFPQNLSSCNRQHFYRRDIGSSRQSLLHRKYDRRRNF
jgi:hypothetical protein